MKRDDAPALDADALTRRLATFAAELAFDAIPKAVIDDIKMHVLDGIGVCLHGSTLPWTRMLTDMVIDEGSKPVTTLWGHGAGRDPESPMRTTPTQAALVNATAGHAFEMDDIHKESVLHPNSLTVPIAFGLAHGRAGVTGRDVLTAIVAGYEVGTRVGNAATTKLFLNGFHPQGTSGAFVAGACAARLLGLDAVGMQNTLGIAGSLGAGLMAAQEGAMVKRLHAGHAAQSGMQAALLASRGFTGISNVIEAEYGGFLAAIAREPDLARLTDGLGETWEAGQVGYKLYPNVTSIHAALDALRALQLEHGLVADDIETIDVGCGHMTYVHTAWPYKPAGVTAAQMNLFYGLSVLALRGEVGPGDYVEARIADADVLAFSQRIRPFEDPRIESRGAAFRHAATMKITLRDGRVLEHDVWHRRASPENPAPDADVIAKFRLNVQGLLSEADASRVIDLVARLETLESIDELVELL